MPIHFEAKKEKKLEKEEEELKEELKELKEELKELKEKEKKFEEKEKKFEAQLAAAIKAGNQSNKDFITSELNNIRQQLSDIRQQLKDNCQQLSDIRQQQKANREAQTVLLSLLGSSPHANKVLERTFEINCWEGQPTPSQSADGNNYKMREVLKDEHGRCEDEILEPIFPGCWLPWEAKCGAHILPRRSAFAMGIWEETLLKGLTSDDICTAKNGIVMARFLELPFDRQEWCLVPSANVRGGELLWEIEIFVPPEQEVVLVDNMGNPCRFIKKCKKGVKLSAKVPSAGDIEDETPLLFGDLVSKPFSLDQRISRRAVVFHAHHAFRAHGRLQEFIDNILPRLEDRNSPPREAIEEYLRNVVPPDVSEVVSHEQPTASPVSEQSWAEKFRKQKR